MLHWFPKLVLLTYKPLLVKLVCRLHHQLDFQYDESTSTHPSVANKRLKGVFLFFWFLLLLAFMLHELNQSFKKLQHSRLFMLKPTH